MTLRECLKKSRFNEDTYICLHNKDDKRFYGAFCKDDDRLKDYYDYEIVYSKPFNESGSIRVIQLKDYEYPLGLDSIRLQEERKAKIEDIIKTKSKKNNL